MNNYTLIRRTLIELRGDGGGVIDDLVSEALAAVSTLEREYSEVVRTASDSDKGMRAARSNAARAIPLLEKLSEIRAMAEVGTSWDSIGRTVYEQVFPLLDQDTEHREGGATVDHFTVRSE